MRKAISIVLLLVMLFLLFSCDFNASLRNRMLEYYSDDSNYSELRGIISSFEQKAHSKEWRFYIRITSENHGFPILTNGEQSFQLNYYSEESQALSVGDEVVFISAPMHFYNGHDLPIVAIKKDDEILLDFEGGKADYLEWIKEEFD